MIFNHSVWELLMAWNTWLKRILFIVIWLPGIACEWSYLRLILMYHLKLHCSKMLVFLFFRLDKNMALKITDFGLSRDVENKEYYKVENTSAELPVRWMSPESLTNWIFTVKSDVVWTYEHETVNLFCSNQKEFDQCFQEEQVKTTLSIVPDSFSSSWNMHCCVNCSEHIIIQCVHQNTYFSQVIAVIGTFWLQWSCGVLLWEIQTFGDYPYKGIADLALLSHLKAGNHLLKPPRLAEDELWVVILFAQWWMW